MNDDSSSRNTWTTRQKLDFQECEKNVKLWMVARVLWVVTDWSKSELIILIINILLIL